MNDPKEQQEPSMEEILASIRRIISEDDEVAEETAEAAPAEEAPADDIDAAGPAADEEASADDIDALMADAGPSTNEEASADDIDALMADAGPAADEEASAGSEADDVLELTEEVQDDGTVVDLDASRNADADDNDDDDMELEAVDIEETAPAAAPNLEGLVEGLVSPPIAAVATTTFAGLASAVEQGRLATSQGIGGRTVEEVVKEVIRPIVKEWLDENLAGLVERLVSREIDRMSRRAQDQIPD